MHLTLRSVPTHLVERGLLSFGDLVDGSVTVSDVSRRNRNFRVTRDTQPCFFVKQVREFDALSIETLRRDARCYWLANNHDEFRALAPLLPPFHTFDVLRSILVLGLLTDVETVHAQHQRTREYPVGLAATTARALAHYHTAFRALPASAASSAFARMHPWVLSTGDPTLFPSGLQTPMGRQLLHLSRARGIEADLARARQRWHVETLIHGDLKWDNCLVTLYGPDAGKLRIIDWEIADVGDPAWDIGSIFQSYLAQWTFSQNATEASPDAHARLTATRPALRAFWDSYVAFSGCAHPRDLLEKSVAFGAGRLVQTAYESLYASPAITPHSLQLLDLAGTILSAGANGYRVLFGD